MREQLSSEWNKPLYVLTPTEHLTCLYRYCFTHYSRNVAKLCGQLDEKVLSAMMSLASSEPLVNYEHIISIIRSGGKKALGAVFLMFPILYGHLASHRLVERQGIQRSVHIGGRLPTTEQNS